MNVEAETPPRKPNHRGPSVPRTPPMGGSLSPVISISPVSAVIVSVPGAAVTAIMRDEYLHGAEAAVVCQIRHLDLDRVNPPGAASGAFGAQRHLAGPG